MPCDLFTIGKGKKYDRHNQKLGENLTQQREGGRALRPKGATEENIADAMCTAYQG